MKIGTSLSIINRAIAQIFQPGRNVVNYLRIAGIILTGVLDLDPIGGHIIVHTTEELVLSARFRFKNPYRENGCAFKTAAASRRVHTSGGATRAAVKTWQKCLNTTGVHLNITVDV